MWACYNCALAAGFYKCGGKGGKGGSPECEVNIKGRSEASGITFEPSVAFATESMLLSRGRLDVKSLKP